MSENRSIKLTTSKVREIRRLAAQGVSRPELRQRFSIADGTLRDVLTRRSWKLVEPDGKVA